MTSSAIRPMPNRAHAHSARRWLPTVPALLAVVVSACAADSLGEDGLEVAGSDQALVRSGVSATTDATSSSGETALRDNGPGRGAGFSCSGSTCTCDKSIENDCEDMSGVCTDETVGPLIDCINGWLTTHCTCTQLRVVLPSKDNYTLPKTSKLAVAF